MTAVCARSQSTAAVFLGALLVYGVLLGGSEAGVFLVPFQAINAVVGFALVASWTLLLRSGSDRTDLLAMVSLLAFLAACVAGAFPRQAFDAATGALVWAGAFGVGRRALLDERNRVLAMRLLGACGLVLALLFTFVWGRVWLEWVRLVGSFPPFDLTLPAHIYRHYYVVAMLLLALLPASVSLLRDRWLRIPAVATVLLTIVLTVMSGSRTVWMGLLVLGVSGAMVAVPSRRTLAVACGAVAVAILTTVPLGWFGPLVDRVLAASTVTYRLDIWTNTLSLWQADPLSGVGPGSIGIGLTLTDLMNGYLFGNRHADNALIQLLGEAGLFGIVTASAAVAAVIAGYRPSRTGARIGLAGLIVLGTMSLTNNPTDSPNLVVLIIFYAALVAPHEVAVSHSLESALMRRIHTWALVGSGAAAILALASFTAAAFAYADGRSLAASGEWDLAAGRLEIAAALDPAMALYHRDLGIVLVESGNWAAADRELQVAINLNRADASALRALAVVQRTTDGDGRAMSSALKAAELRPLAAENWLAVAFVSADVDATAAATAAIRVAPWLSGSPFWADDFTGARLQSILEDAASASVASPVPRGEAARAWLTAVTNHDVHEQADAPEEVALDHVLRCETADAEAAYRDLDWSESTAGIVGRLMLARLTDAADTGDLSRIVALRHPDLGAAAQGHASAYSLFADPVADAQMYRRLGLGPATPGPVVPRTTDALGVWMMSPVETARRGAPEAALARCR